MTPQKNKTKASWLRACDPVLCQFGHDVALYQRIIQSSCALNEAVQDLARRDLWMCFTGMHQLMQKS